MIPSWTFSFHLYLPPRSLDYFTANTRHFSFMLSRHSAVLCLVAQLYPTLCSPMDGSLPGSSVHGDSPVKNTGVGDWALLLGSSQPRDQMQVCCIAGGFFTIWAIREALCSVQFSRSVVSDSLWPHRLQPARLPCPSPPWSLLKLMSICQWCYLTISSSVIPFFSHHQSFPALGSFPVGQLFVSGGQSIGVSASASVLSINIQDWFPLGWTGWFSLQFKGLSRVFSNITVQKHQFFGTQPSLWSNSHIHTWLLGKPIILTRWTFVGKVMSLLFNMLSRLVIAFRPRSKRLLISQLQSPSAVILELQKIVSHCFHCFPIYLPWSDGTGCHDLSFLNVEF